MHQYQWHCWANRSVITNPSAGTRARDGAIRAILFIAFLLASNVAWPFADEEHDWGIPPTKELRQQSYSAPTPLAIPGASIITTVQLQALLKSTPETILIDVAAGDGHVTLRGAYWLPGAGRGNHFFDPLQAQLAEYLAQLSKGDKTRPLVFFCVSAQCWLSYNASLRASILGYSRVYWYRGGIEAWNEAGLPLAKVSLAP